MAATADDLLDQDRRSRSAPDRYGPRVMIDRIQELRSQAERAISTAGSSAELEELRVRYLGRKAELPQLLRGVAELPAEQRGAVGKAANQARQALESLIAARVRPVELSQA